MQTYGDSLSIIGRLKDEFMDQPKRRIKVGLILHFGEFERIRIEGVDSAILKH